jgi:uncharacterized protein
MSATITPPFADAELAARKVQIAEDLWNTRDPERIAAAYTEDSVWRNRVEFLQGREAIIAFLRRKWSHELDYKLRKELWGFRGNRMAGSLGMSGTMTADSGSAAMATSCGNLQRTD